VEVPATEHASVILRVNGRARALGGPAWADAAEDVSLLEALRDGLGLTGAKYGCGEGRCGACVVLLAGKPTPACVTPLSDAVNTEITTVEGLGANGTLHPVQQAFLDTGALQCGYCTPGMIVAAVALLRDNPQPTRQQVVDAMAAHICRCGVYGRIIAAIQLAAARMNTAPEGGAASPPDGGIAAGGEAQ
jgi:nicotinate dehydrogenase subunit A